MATVTKEEMDERFDRVDVGIDQLTDIAHMQTKTLDKLVSMIARHDERIAHHDDILAELRRDNAQTRRLWLHLCRKYGWLDDEDVQAGR